MKTNLIFNGILLFTILFLLICLLILPLSPAQTNQPDLTAWLTEHPFVSEAIRWEDSNGTKAYSNWSATQKADLLKMYQKVWNNEPLELTDPPPNIVNLPDNSYSQTVLSKDHAWPLFLAHVAHSLVVETGEWVPWSLTEYSQTELLELFDGSKMFRFNNELGSYEPIHKGIPAPPDFTFEFLSNNNIIAQDRLRTIGNLLDWCRSNMIHFSGGWTAKNMEDHWQYRGLTPISRVISGTKRVLEQTAPAEGPDIPLVIPGPDHVVEHHTAGCWGTTAFLRAVLRVPNIPVKQMTAAGHSLPYFMSEGKYLSHADDPYNRFSSNREFDHPHPFPIEELFIDQATYDAWFGPGATLESTNVGRRTRELAIEYLPRLLLKQRCKDILDGRSHANSHVYRWTAFDRNYSVEELEAVNLWKRMDAKIARIGGCATLQIQIPITSLPMKSLRISEIMVASNEGHLPQWIELYNHSNTHEVNLMGWKLEIQNYRSANFNGELNLRLTFTEKSIKPQKTLLIVSKQGRTSKGFPDEQIYNLNTLHPNLHNMRLSEDGFYMKLSNSIGKLVDEVGNLDGKRKISDSLIWRLPTSVTEDGGRASMIRRYDSDSSYLGTDASAWVSAKNTKLATGATTYYGHPDDIGAPGVRSGGALPVTLSYFRAELTQAGVVLKWTTESEVNNAGFYIHRGQVRDSEFKVINPTMIQGAGTTSERNTYTWKDTTVKSNVAYYYRIEDVSHAGERKQLATVRMRGLVSASGKLTTLWADLKAEN